MTDYERARAWLFRARNIDEEIRELESTRDKLFDELTRITGSYDKLAVQSSPDPHKFDGLAALSSQIAEQVNRLLRTKAEIEAVIDRLDDDRFRRVLRLRFVRCLTMEQTAVEVHYSYKHTKRMQARGIEAVAEILRERRVFSE